MMVSGIPLHLACPTLVRILPMVRERPASIEETNCLLPLLRHLAGWASMLCISFSRYARLLCNLTEDSDKERLTIVVLPISCVLDYLVAISPLPGKKKMVGELVIMQITW